MKQPKITLETAKALYAQGGMARQVSLERFSESDLTEPKWPKSWEELASIKGHCVEADRESIIAFCQLRQLADRMNEGWEPSKRNRGYTVGYQWPSSTGSGLHSTIASKFYKELIVFKTREMADFSRQHHKDLWEKYWKV